MKHSQTEILYGIHPVFEALKAGKRSFFEFYIAKEKITKRLDKMVAAAEERNVTIKKVSAAQLASTAGSHHHQGVGALVSRYPVAALADIFNRAESDPQSYFLLLLDNIMDPHNLGALVRTALCVGIDGVIISKDRSVRPSPAVSKASAGALEHIRLVKVTNIANTIRTLKKKGLWILGLDRAAQRSIFVSDLKGSMAVVIGGEEKGLRPLVQKQCDVLLSIPQNGPVNSLNASVAGAVVMYEAFRQRSDHQST